MTENLTETVAMARLRLDAERKDGVVCPCCDQYVKLYKRKLNSGMAYGLILIHRYFQQPVHDEWLHVPTHHNLSRIGGDIAKLCHWDLLEAMPGKRDDGSTHMGFFKITPRGQQFVRGQILVARHVFLYNQTCFGFSEQRSSIREALGDRFSYDELMAEVAS